jgi:4-hydroxybutyrate CoA-transferase
MDLKSIYESKLVSAKEAVKHIKSGNRVVVQHAAGEPLTLVDAMVKNKAAYKDVEIVHLVALGKGEYTMPEMCGNFTHNALFVGASTRKSVNDARKIICQ